MLKKILNYFWEHGLALGGYALLALSAIDLAVDLTFIDITGFLFTYAVWSLLAILLTRRNKVFRQLYKDIKDKEWAILFTYLELGFNLKTSIIAIILYYMYDQQNQLYIQYQRDLELGLTNAMDYYQAGVSVLIFNGFFLIFAVIAHGFIQNVHKRTYGEKYLGHRY